jgi:hypothetical protein
MSLLSSNPRPRQQMRLQLTAAGVMAVCVATLCEKGNPRSIRAEFSGRAAASPQQLKGNRSDAARPAIDASGALRGSPAQSSASSPLLQMPTRAERAC